jgi:SAM-dependent methyltransferase
MLTEQQLEGCKSKFKLSYHIYYAKTCQDLVGFADKDVLEVGGSLPPEFVFDYLGAKTWTGVETPDYEKSLAEIGGLTHQGTIIKNIDQLSDLSFKHKQNQRYNFYLDNIENLPETYYCQYDLIFSIATFEHIHKLPQALDKMFFALKPGGKVFTIFCPIWSAHDGHHLPEITDKQGNNYNFANSPIPPWGHLLMTRGEMTKYLHEKIDKETADQMIYYVYQSNHINRYFTEDYFNALELSLFTTNKLELIFPMKINNSIEEQLKILYPKNNYFANNGILAVLEKSYHLANLNLSKLNFIIFPDWSQPESEIFPELNQNIKELISNQTEESITLLIDSTGLSLEDADISLEAIYLNFFSEFSLDISEYLNILMLPELTTAEWETLLPQLHSRIKMNKENQAIITKYNL